MTDCIQTPPSIWQTALIPGDIVAFRFPHERPSSEDPKVRPTLVLDILCLGNESYAVLAYGTSSPRRRARDLLVPVTSMGELDTASLKAPTQFDAARRVVVPLSDSGFSCCRKVGSPVLGRLSGESAERAGVVRRRVRHAAVAQRASLYGTRSRVHQSKTDGVTPIAETRTQGQEPQHV